jgi:hypothetical protein
MCNLRQPGRREWDGIAGLTAGTKLPEGAARHKSGSPTLHGSSAMKARPLCFALPFTFFILFVAAAPSRSASNERDDREVRIVSVEGDVRLSPGDGKHTNLKKQWESFTQSSIAASYGASVHGWGSYSSPIQLLRRRTSSGGGSSSWLIVIFRLGTPRVIREAV